MIVFGKADRLLAFERLVLRWPPDAGERQDAARLVVGFVVYLDVVAYEVIEVEQAHRTSFCTHYPTVVGAGPLLFTPHPL